MDALGADVEQILFTLTVVSLVFHCFSLEKENKEKNNMQRQIETGCIILQYETNRESLQSDTSTEKKNKRTLT